MRDDLTSRPDQVTTDDDINIWISWDAEWTHPDPRQPSADVVERGHCAGIRGLSGQHDPLAHAGDPRIGSYWPELLRYAEDRPTRILGIAEDEMDAAVDLLIDVAREHRARVAALTTRRDRTIDVLTQLAAATRRGDAWHAVNKAKLRAAVRRAASEELIGDDQIAEITRLTVDQVSQERDYVDQPDLFVQVDEAGFAKRLGIGVSSLRSYKARGRLPEPDASLGKTPGWRLATVERYARSRPGQGVRTDLQAIGVEPTMTATINVVTGRLTVDVPGPAAVDLAVVGGRAVPTLAEMEPWGAEEMDLDRADEALTGMGWARQGDWSQDDGAEDATCAVTRA